ncbi:MAG: hypothetical protein JSS76_13690 [Bacteroidetes bacterium]|nr:hypothetical protein [Bacteroidota bacterium]
MEHQFESFKSEIERKNKLLKYFTSYVDLSDSYTLTSEEYIDSVSSIIDNPNLPAEEKLIGIKKARKHMYEERHRISSIEFNR